MTFATLDLVRRLFFFAELRATWRTNVKCASPHRVFECQSSGGIRIGTCGRVLGARRVGKAMNLDHTLAISCLRNAMSANASSAICFDLVCFLICFVLFLI